MKFLNSISIISLLLSGIAAKDFCNTTKHSGKSVTETDINVGSIGDIGYEIWYQGGENSATFYEDGSFTCSFKKSKDYLCRSGLSFDSTKTHEEIGHLYADFKLIKKDTEDVDYSYIGIYGWSREPLIEYYVVDNWLSEYRPGDWVGEKKHGDFIIDGAEYTVYENTRYNAPSIDGETTFKQFFSVRKEARECGTIDITAHFKKWEELGMKLGKLHEAKVLGEAGSIHDGTSGTADFPYAKVYIGDKETEVEVESDEEIENLSENEVEVDASNVSEQVEEDSVEEDEVEVDATNVSEQAEEDSAVDEEIENSNDKTDVEEKNNEKEETSTTEAVEETSTEAVEPIPDGDFCAVTKHTGKSVTETEINVGSIGDIGYEIWYQGGENSATFYEDGSFTCSFKKSKDYLCRSGLSFDSTKTHEEIGHLYADFKLIKKDTEDVDYSYIGIYGWSREPLIEYYVVDNWLSEYRPGDWVGEKKHGDFIIDGAEYTVYENTRYNAPSIDGETTFKQFFSVRKEARECGTIDITAHFKKWEELGMKLGKLHEAKVLGEAGSIHDGTSGTADFPYAKVYIGDKKAEVEVESEKIDDLSENEVEVDASNVSEQAEDDSAEEDEVEVGEDDKETDVEDSDVEGSEKDEISTVAPVEVPTTAPVEVPTTAPVEVPTTDPVENPTTTETVEPTSVSDFCAVTKHTGKSVTETEINVGSIGDIGYEIWYQGGENSATFYEDGSFTCSFKKSKDYLCRSGLSFDSTKTHEEIGHLYADFKLIKKDTEDVDYSYIGIYGWSREPLIEYYVVDNWLSQYRPGDWVGEKKHGDFIIDGAEYTVYENTRYNAPSIDGETTFKQFFSVRKEARECGTIDITAHFKKWEELGMKLGKLHEAKVLGEAGSIHDGTSGTADFPYAKVYIKEEATQEPTKNTDRVINIMPIGDSITFGIGEDGGYRKYLYNLLKENGYNFDFVGTEGEDIATVEIDGKTYTYDDNNEAHSGFTMKQITTSWSNDSGLYETLLRKDAIKKSNPDVILLIIGTNDMTANRKMDICEYDFHTLLDYFYRDMKEEGIVIIGTIPEFREYGGTAERVANFNAVVKKVAEDYASNGKNIKFVDIHGSLDGMNDIGEDKLHPTGKGYEKIAKLWYKTLDEEVLPELLSQEPTSTEPTATEPATEPTSTEVVEPIPDGDFCAVTKHTGKSVTETDINVGSIGDIGYEIWYQGGENSATFYEDGSFTCSFKKSKDYLCRSGLSFDSTKTHEEIGHLYADFKLIKKDTEDVDYSYIGIYGWSREPLIEYYVVDNWLSQYRPGDWVGEKKHGDFIIDGAEYTVYENTRYNAPSIDGETTFKQFFSVRKEARECGTIDITAHFKKWEELGMKLGKLHEAKVLGEAGSIHDGTSGTADFPYAKVYIKEEESKDAVRIMPIGDSITFGYGEDGGYRKYLYNLLKENGYNFDFVGTEGQDVATVEIDGKTYTYDDNNEAYSGFTMLQQPNSWSNDSGLYEKLIRKDSVKKSNPDVILLMIGTNDMTANRDMKSCENDLHSVLDYFYRDMKEEGVVIIGTIPEFREYGGTAERVANFNAVVKKVAEDYASEDKNIKFVDIHGSLDGMNDIGEDKLHPNGKGYQKIAKKWFKALEKILPNPTEKAKREECSSIWNQCGGKGYTGPTCCSEGSCVEVDEFFSQCQKQ